VRRDSVWGKRHVPENIQVLKQKVLLEGVLFVYRFPPMSRPGFRRETMSLFECFFGERVF
jgi:hypothetical protein